MKKKPKKPLRGLLIIWCVWSCLLAGYEILQMQIPMTMRIYEDEALNVLSGPENRINPQELYLDFAGDISLKEAENNCYEAECHLFGVIPVKTMELEVVKRQSVIPGGIPVGIYVQTNGVFVVGTGDVETATGTVESPAKNILKTGDYIVEIGGKEITGKRELLEILQSWNRETIILKIRRNEEFLDISIKPVRTEGGCSIGVWVRDDTQGVGTLTYVTKERKFGALGHGISDTDSNLLMEVCNGRLYACEITGIERGKCGNPGKLSGKINYNEKNMYGKITGNVSGGVYGIGNSKLLQQMEEDEIPIALKQEIKEGEAVILSSVSGTMKEYEVEIIKIYRGDSDVNKGMELVVTDPELLALTGGIVQGMSGSPIIQDGKLVGAVTHVLVNDPTRGYGIFIENMLEAAE